MIAYLKQKLLDKYKEDKQFIRGQEEPGGGQSKGLPLCLERIRSDDIDAIIRLCKESDDYNEDRMLALIESLLSSLSPDSLSQQIASIVYIMFNISDYQMVREYFEMEEEGEGDVKKDVFAMIVGELMKGVETCEISVVLQKQELVDSVVEIFV